MSWIPTMSDAQATPEVKRMYDHIRERWGFVPNYFHALGRNAQLLSDQMNLFTNAMYEDRGLPRVIKEEIALVVSGLNTSTYCLAAHMEILGSLGVPKAIGRKLAVDYANAPVEPKVMEIFKFVAKLTQRPAEMEHADLERLRTAGWNDEEIHDAILVTALYNCANRYSGALGLLADFEDENAPILSARATG